MWLRLGFLVLLCGSVIESSNILVLFPSLASGQQMPVTALVEAFLEKGHQVTLIGQSTLEVNNVSMKEGFAVDRARRRTVD